jgi:4-hydroxy-tetrahydrodipicolinate reductase
MAEEVFVFKENMSESKYYRSNISTKPRILIYGVGQYGKTVAKIALKKGWPIVGAVNRAGDKIGQDLGRILALDTEIGITIEDCEIADYLGMKADVGIVAISDYLKDTFPAYKHLLNAGINVICHGAQASFPQGVNPEISEEIDVLAKKNKVTLTGTSLWDMTRVGAGLLVTGPCTDINALSHKSITDVSQGGLHAMDFCGVGLTENEFAKRMNGEESPLSGFHTGNVLHVLYQLGYKVSQIKERNEAIFFKESIYCKALDRTLDPSTTVGTQIVSEIHTEEGIIATLHTELRLLLPNEKEYVEWSVDGMPNCSIRVDRRNSVYHSASTLFNRIPDVVSAMPGLRLCSDLGPMQHTALIPNLRQNT